MYRSWGVHLDLGVVHYMAFPEMMSAVPPDSPVDRLRFVALDSDFSAIDVTHFPDAAGRSAAAELLKGAGLRVFFGGAGPLSASGLSLCDLREPEREKAVAFAKGLIDEALTLGAELIFVISGPDPGPENREAAGGSLRKSLHSLCAYAMDHSTSRLLSVAVEPSDRNIQHRQLVGPHAEAAALATDLRRDHENFGLVLDLSHIHELGEDPDVVVRLCRDSIRHVHLSNTVLDDSASPLYGDQHPPFGVPGSRVDVPGLAAFIQQCLAELPAKPSMSLEIKARPHQDSEVLVAAGKRSFVKAWTLLEAKRT